MLVQAEFVFMKKGRKGAGEGAGGVWVVVRRRERRRETGEG